jgi:TatD DNase family protein
MKFIDTHCHIDMILEKHNLKSFDELKVEFPDEYEGLLHISCHPESMGFADELRREHSEVYCAYGIHPHDAKLYTDQLHSEIYERMSEDKVVAWGEMGLDYFYDYSPREIQKEVFARQLKCALELGKACVIHTRQADEDTIEVLKECVNSQSKIHIHCFTGSVDFARQLLNLPGQIYFGFTGVITFKSAESICESLAVIPMNRLLLETDSPFMAPTPFRGKICHPGHIPFIAQKMADVKNCLIKEIYEQCRQNTQDLYGF